MDQILSRRERERQIRKSEIIGAARKLFLEKGFEETSMDDVARESQFTKRTLYQYFVNKEDLYYSVAIKEADLLNSYMAQALEKKVNALEKLRLCCIAYYRFYEECPKSFRVISYNPSRKPNGESSPYLEEVMNYQRANYEKFLNVFEEGKKDGSIKPDIDEKKAAYFGIITIQGFFYTLSATDTGYWDLYGFKKDDFIDFFIDNIVAAYAAKEA